MPRYIDAHSLARDIIVLELEAERNKKTERLLGLRNSRVAISLAPTADVAEVKHGDWIRNEGVVSCCNQCGCCVKECYNYPYCPNCGAKMDGTPKERGAEK